MINTLTDLSDACESSSFALNRLKKKKKWPCVLSSGACVHGHDEPTDDHSSADATDPVPSSAAGPAATTASSNAPAGKTTHIHAYALVLWLEPVPGLHVWMRLF